MTWRVIDRERNGKVVRRGLPSSDAKDLAGTMNRCGLTQRYAAQDEAVAKTKPAQIRGRRAK